MIELESVGKRYRRGRTALHDVSVRLDGGIVGLLGPNGAGKTTLLQLVVGVARPTTGIVRVMGHDLACSRDLRSVRAAIGYLPQRLEPFPDLTGHEFLSYIGTLKGLDAPAVRDEATALLARVGLASRADERVRTYSGGMRRRLGIAQALLGDPRIVIVDEPTAGLDPEERIRFREIIAEAAVGRTVVLSTHILGDVAELCSRTIVLAEGAVRFDGTADALAAHARGRVFRVAGDDEAGAAGVPVRRVVAAEPPAGGEPIAPTIEDGYVALLRGLGAPDAAVATSRDA